ncbi:MAG: GNAT family N-acetyltransferase [Tepidisphaeraceae bacterium]
MTFLIQRVHVDRVIDLRHRVLRAGLPREAARFDGDDEPTTHHLVAVTPAGDVIGCCTLLHRPWTDGQPAWQLRGMAVDPTIQKTGIGAALLKAADDLVRSTDHSRLLWCNARARPFRSTSVTAGWLPATSSTSPPQARTDE